MGAFLKADRLRWACMAAALAVSLGASAASAAKSGVDRVAERLGQGEASITAELARLAVASRNDLLIKEALERCGLDRQPDAVIRKTLGNFTRKDPKGWAAHYRRLKRPGAAAASKSAKAPKSLRLDRQALLAEKLAKKLDLSGDDISGKLEKVFDGDDRSGGMVAGAPGIPNPGEGKPSVGDWLRDRLRKKPEAGRITFDDVIGIDEAKKELMEVVEMLKNPERYRRVGADIPTGILMSGPPGTGKTFTARALANEAGVDFIAMDGSEFTSKWVGESPNRVRKLFAEARSKAPCIIFIDEIDALAGKRTDASDAADKELNSVVTQLLIEMDGLTEDRGGKKPLVILIGATNRTDALDPAVLRPGRFDRKIIFNLPDVEGRKKLLDLYVKKKRVPTAPDYDAQLIAKRTTGMSPAEVKNLVNEAAVLAARDNVEQVAQKHFERAVDRIAMGRERKIVMTEEDKRTTALHELGHALVGHFVPHGDPITKITIIPRDIGALGATMSEPERDRLNWSNEQLLARIAMAMGGRAAEKLSAGHYTTGAGSDLQNAKSIASQMVLQYGMSDELGPVTFVRTESGNYLNRGGKLEAISEATQRKIDAVIKGMLLEQEKRAAAVLTAHWKTLEKLVPILVAKETLEGPEFRALVRQLEGGDVAKDPKAPGGGKG